MGRTPARNSTHFDIHIPVDLFTFFIQVAKMLSLSAERYFVVFEFTQNLENN